MQHLLTSLLVAFVPACYPPPVDAPVTRPFVAPPCAYCPGHRGLEYRVSPGTPVRAVSGGVVRFSGLVAGTMYVVVLQDDGLVATYGDLDRAVRRAGDPVRVSEMVGASTATVYFGLRDGDQYLDPAPRLGRWRRRPRLVPSGDRAARPGRPPSLHCPAG